MVDKETSENHFDNEFIVIKTYSDEVFADIDAGHLKSNNISSYVLNDDPTQVGALRSSRLMVRRVDKQRALKVLEAMH